VENKEIMQHVLKLQ